MSIKRFRFTKTKIGQLVHEGKPITVKDTQERALCFQVGRKRSVFKFEKRVAGRKGSPITITLGMFPHLNVDEARQQSRDLATLCEKGIDPREKKEVVEAKVSPTLAQARENYWEMKGHLRLNSIKDWQSIERNHVPKEWWDMCLNDLSANMIIKHVQSLQERYKVVPERFLKWLCTVWNRNHLHYLDDKNETVIKENPVKLVRQMMGKSKRQPKRTVIKDHNLGRFVVLLEDLIAGRHCDRMPGQITKYTFKACLLTLFTGLRFCEARSLRWEDVDLEFGTIHLKGEREQDKGCTPFEGTKNRQDHWVALSTYPWDMLRAHWKVRVDSTYVFPGTRLDRPMSYQRPPLDYFVAHFKDDYTPHASRRTFASVANAVGHGFLTVKRMLNHSYEGGTTGGYVVPDFNPQERRDDFQKVCDYILEKRAAYLNKTDPDSSVSKEKKLKQVRSFALSLGLEMADLESLNTAAEVVDISRAG